MDLSHFDLEIDVTLKSAISDFESVVQDLTSSMQETLGPEFVMCPPGPSSALAIKKFSIANALFEAQHDETQACLSTAESTCFRMVATVTLYLKGQEDLSKLLEWVAVVMGEGSNLIGKLTLDTTVFKSATTVEFASVACI